MFIASADEKSGSLSKEIEKLTTFLAQKDQEIDDLVSEVKLVYSHIVKLLPTPLNWNPPNVLEMYVVEFKTVIIRNLSIDLCGLL